MRASCRHLADALDRCSGPTLQQRWNHFEKKIWPKWSAGIGRPSQLWTWGARVLVPARMVVPSIEWLHDVRVNQWIVRLPEEHPLVQQHRLLLRSIGGITWTGPLNRHQAVCNGLRILLVRGYDNLRQIQEEDMRLLHHRWSHGTDALDATLCSLGVFSRTPKRGSARYSRRRRLAASELVEVSDVPPRFRQVMILYLETYEARVSGVYRTLRQKANKLAHFWRFIHEKHRNVKCCSAVLPRHVRDYIPGGMAIVKSSAPSNVALIPEKKLVRRHTAGWSNCEPSFPIFVLGQLNLIPHSRLLLLARFRSTGTRSSAMVSKKRVREPGPVSPPPSLNLSARCPRSAPSRYKALKAAVAAPEGHHFTRLSLVRRGRHLLGLGTARTTCPERFAYRRSQRTDYPGHSQAVARRWTHLLLAAHQAFEV